MDYDGNTYNSVTIGTQVWMKENLKVTHYRNRDPIPNVTDSIQWKNLQIPANNIIYLIRVNILVLKMQIYSTTGQCLIQKELYNNKNEIDISFLISGIDIMKLTGPNWTMIKKIVKE